MNHVLFTLSVVGIGGSRRATAGSLYHNTSQLDIFSNPEILSVQVNTDDLLTSGNGISFFGMDFYNPHIDFTFILCLMNFDFP